ncbi:actinodefensin-associated protein B [Myceligenerans crystallogenes]|uniref:Coenzyme PQQ synthesis protein D (PqqD) n=1 Tax=Myceligenerans crystallogenes TaxID=316335 RepID=A0ABP4ZYX3_9MICO
MSTRYRLADGVTCTPTPEGGSILIDVTRDRVFALNKTATAVLTTLVARQHEPLPEILDRAVRDDPDQAPRWTERLAQDLVSRRLLTEERT